MVGEKGENGGGDTDVIGGGEFEHCEVAVVVFDNDVMGVRLDRANDGFLAEISSFT